MYKTTYGSRVYNHHQLPFLDFPINTSFLISLVLLALRLLFPSKTF